jgi:hypothetical protein
MIDIDIYHTQLTELAKKCMYCDFVKDRKTGYVLIKYYMEFLNLFMEYLFVPVEKNCVIPFTGRYFKILPSV